MVGSCFRRALHGSRTGCWANTLPLQGSGNGAGGEAIPFVGGTVNELGMSLLRGRLRGGGVLSGTAEGQRPRTGSERPAAPPLRQRVITAALVALVILGGAFATVLWFEADKEVRILCGLMREGTSRAEVARVLETANLLQVRPAGVEPATASALSFDAAANFCSTRCAVSLGEAGVTGSTFSRTIRLERIAATLAGCLLLLLFGLQVGLATGRISGRMAWGGRSETLPRSHRVASALTAPLMLVMAWVLLERAGVTDVVESDTAIAGAAWAVTLLFLLSTAGNLASTSRPERRFGIPVATAMVILGLVVSYSG